MEGQDVQTTSESENPPKPQPQIERQPHSAPRQIHLFSAVPTQSLTRSLPHGAPANILTLSNDFTAGSGQDVRSLLFTCYAERGLPSRGKMRANSCHESKEIVARDVLFLSLLLEGPRVEGDEEWERLWEIYHSPFVEGDAVEMVAQQVGKILAASFIGLEAWRESDYGQIIDFVDELTLQQVRGVWEQYQDTALTPSAGSQDQQGKTLLSSMAQAKQIRDRKSADVKRELSMSGLRSTAPIPLSGREHVMTGYEEFWDHNGLSQQALDGRSSRRCPNPLITSCLAHYSSGSNQGEEKKVLHYATNPLLGYHLGTALAKLAPESPYSAKLENSSKTSQHARVSAAVRVQFREWASAFVDMARNGHVSVQYALGEPIALLEHMSIGFKTSTKKAKLAQFDVIDTSNLADEHGFLDLLIAARPLLKPRQTSVLYTECLRRTTENSYKGQLKKLMCGDPVVNSLILGLAPMEYSSNTSFESCIDDVLIKASYDKNPSELLQNHFKASWRPTGVSCTGKLEVMAAPKLTLTADDTITILFDALNSWENLNSASPLSSGAAGLVHRRLTNLMEACCQYVETDWSDVKIGLLQRLEGGEQSLPFKDTFVSAFEKLHMSGGALSPDQKEGLAVSMNEHASLKVRLGFEKAVLSSLTVRIDIGSESAKAALQDSALVKTHQTNPYTITIMVGDYLLGEKAVFPVPVLISKTTTRVARKSGYIELVTRVVDPVELEEQSAVVFPVTIGDVHDTDHASRKMPILLNNHSVNLDSLPMISVNNESDEARKANAWLGTVTSQQFSMRERKERELSHEDDTVATSTRLNLKEAIFTMFMLASGLQGGSTGLFALSHSTKGNQMLIFVRALRLDASVGSVVADAAVLPITRKLLDSGELETFLLVLRELDACVIDVTDEEIVLWKQILPGFVERCRTWEHVADCAYESSGRVPLSTDAETPFLCNCGNGKLPNQYMGGLPEWDVAAKHVVRVAISPLFAVPWVEDIMDVEMVRAGGGMDGMDNRRDRCRSCGAFARQNDIGSPDVADQPLLRCMRCKSAMYCSQACQKKDWKKHRAECQPPS